MVLTEMCQELKHWFCDVETDIHYGTYTIENGLLSLPFLIQGQYFRIVGSAFNDGVYVDFDGNICGDDGKSDASLQDEVFSGAIWAMKVPPSVVKLGADIEAWVEKNGDAVSSPYQSESWGGYSYSLKRGSGESGALDWRTIFAGALNRWRKLIP